MYSTIEILKLKTNCSIVSSYLLEIKEIEFLIKNSFFVNFYEKRLKILYFLNSMTLFT